MHFIARREMLIPNPIPRSPKQTVLTLLLLLSVLWLGTSHWNRSSIHSIQLSAFDGHSTSPVDISQVCAAHNFRLTASSYTTDENGDRKRRVYDFFLLSTELDWLEIRLNTLYAYVDYFVIVESDRTFTGRPKPLSLRENWSKFDSFHPKIIYVVVEDKVSSTRTWDHEDAFRNGLLYETMPQIAGKEQEPRYGDAMIISDIDEIPRPETVKLLRYCDFPDRLTLRSHFYYYSFQWLHRGQQWAHPQATVYRGLESTISPVDLRNDEGGPGFSLFRPLQRARQRADLYDAAWHCSSCFRTVKEMQTKIQSFSHTPWNTEQNRDPKTMIERVRNGIDLFNRPGEIYDKIESNPDVPRYILEHSKDFKYMLDRDGEEAGFEDAQDLGLGPT